MVQDEEIKTLLESEIRNEFKKLSMFDAGSKEYSGTVENLATLYKLHIDEKERDRAFYCKQAETDADLQLKKSQLREDVINRYIRVGVDTAAIVLPLIFYGIWMKQGFKFEETGTFTSSTFRGLISKFRPR